MCPLLVSVLAVAATLLVTMSVLFWNYSETRQRRMTKKQSIILDHWGKHNPTMTDMERIKSLQVESLNLSLPDLDINQIYKVF